MRQTNNKQSETSLLFINVEQSTISYDFTSLKRSLHDIGHEA